MLSVAEALAVVLQQARPLAAEIQPLDSSVLGLTLAEDVTSDIDMPPHDKALMDGYAVRRDDLAAGNAILTVIEEVTAGRTPQRAIGRDQSTRIMTGAPIPAGTDAVVMIERTRTLDDNRVSI